MNVHFAAMMAALMSDFGRVSPWDGGFMTEKSDLPKKEPMPLTPEESEKLASLSGKEKKNYLKEMRAKYEA